MAANKSIKTEKSEYPHSGFRFVLVLGVIVLIAALVAGIWYFLSGRKGHPETPRTSLVLALPNPG
jgi:hypothetical protein